jgi:ankyrin repeat protein
MALLQAAGDGDLARVQRLIREGANIHEVGTAGRNALMHAVINNHAPVVLWLIKTGGARISDTGNYGGTALSIAAEYGYHSLVQWMLEDGGATITDRAVIYGEHKTLWYHLNVNESAGELQSLLKVMHGTSR